LGIVAPMRGSRLRCRPMACGSMDPASDENTPRRDNASISIGGVLGEIARRQLADVDVLDVFDARLNMRVDDSAIKLGEILDNMTSRFGMLHWTSDAVCAEAQAGDDELVELFDATVAAAEEKLREAQAELRKCRQERGRAAANAEGAHTSELGNWTAFTELRAKAKSQAKERALARAAVVKDKPPVVEDKAPVVEDKAPVVEDKPPVVEDKPPILLWSHVSASALMLLAVLVVADLVPKEAPLLYWGCTVATAGIADPASMACTI